MEKKQIKIAAFLASLFLCVLLLGWWLLPRMVAALPTDIRGRLPENMMRLAITPLPTALPLPANPVVFDSGLPMLAVLPTQTKTPLPTTAVTTPQSDTVSEDNSPTSTPQPTPTLTPSPTPLPQRTILTGLTNEPQKYNNCGPANLSILFNYYNQDFDQLEIAKAVKPHYEDRNVSPYELVDYVNENSGLKAAVYRGGDLDLLKRLLIVGFPVIIEKGYEPSEWQGWMGHYLTIYGYDDVEQFFWSMDSFLGPWEDEGRPYSYSDIKKYWSQFNNTFILLYEPEDEAVVTAVLGSTHTDPQTMWQNALTQTQNQLAADPKNAFAWANLSLNLLELADYNPDESLNTQAASALDQARLAGLPPRMLWYQPELYAVYLSNGRYDDVLTLTNSILENPSGQHVEETFFYRGEALRALGELDQAAYAYQRALELKPHYPAALAAQNNLH